MRVLVVIVNYRTPQLTIDCLRSLESEVQAVPGTHVSVTDNQSGDDSVSLISNAIRENRWESWVTFLPLDRNGGFAYGNNRGMRPFLAGDDKPDFVYLLNPDTRAFPGIISELLRFMDSHPRAGFAGSRAENEDGTPRRAAFRFHTIVSEFESMAGIGLLSNLLRRHVVAPPVPTENFRCDWASGAGLMVRRQVIDEVGLLDDGYFMYYEETDWCRRAARRGWECWYVPASRYIHLVGQASGVTGSQRAKKRRPLYWFESRQRYFLKNHGWLYTQAAKLAWISGYSIQCLKRSILRRPNQQPPYLGRDFLRYNFSPLRSKRKETVPTPPSQDLPSSGKSAEPAGASEQRSQPRSGHGTSNQNPPGISFWSLVREDLRTHDGDLFSQGFWALFQNRLGNWRMGIRSKLLRYPFTLLYRFLHKWVQWTCGISLSYTVKVGRRVHIWHFGGMILGAREIGDDVHIRQNTTLGLAKKGGTYLDKPTIEDRVDLGAGVVIVGPIRVGHDSVVGANAVVTKDVQPFTVVGGVPAKVISVLTPKPAPAPTSESADACDCGVPQEDCAPQALGQ